MQAVRSSRSTVAALLCGAGLLSLLACSSQSAAVATSGAQNVPAGYAASNVDVVGYSDVDGRPPFKLAIREAGGKWYLYMGHLWDRGWTILDVTDPSTPQMVKFIPGPENTWTIQMELAEDKMITAVQRGGAGWGTDPDKPFDEGFLIWDMSDPVNPRKLGQFHTGGTGTHRNFYAGGRYVHLAAGAPGYDGQIYMIADINDPANPVEVGRWWVPGQHTAKGETPSEPGVSLHGPPYVADNLVYLSYGAAGMVILDISDVSKPKLVGQVDFTPPFLANIGVHSVLPIPDRHIALTNSESIAEDCQETLNQASIVDISDPSKPTLLSLLPLPTPPPGSPYADFCGKGGRFGPHNVNHHQHSRDVQQQRNLHYLTYFNAGLRIFDTTDPRQPTEVGYFIPPEPTQRYGPVPKNKLVLQTEDVLVDRRGYIYITQKNQGLWILKGTGPAAEGQRITS